MCLGLIDREIAGDACIYQILLGRSHARVVAVNYGVRARTARLSDWSERDLLIVARDVTIADGAVQISETHRNLVIGAGRRRERWVVDQIVIRVIGDRWHRLTRQYLIRHKAVEMRTQRAKGCIKSQILGRSTDDFEFYSLDGGCSHVRYHRFIAGRT